MSLPVALLNAPVLTTDGIFTMQPISIIDARELCKDQVISYIGHAGTANIMQTLLKISVDVSRAELRQQVSQSALVFSLNKRQAEGVILDEAAIEAVGYTFKLITKIA